jgi:phosphoenolpyruvate---glycerone phosphotransferase subunit DhaL
MDRGMKKALERLEATDGDDIGASLKAVGMALVSSVGGAAGPLYGTLFLQMGQSAAGRSELDLAGFTEALDAGVQGVIKRGKAEPGDKTMLDALGPALEALRAADGDDVADALQRAAEAAREGMEATVPLVARKGRASYLGERSAGHQDPGATSSHLLLKTAAEAAAGGG